MTSTAPPRPELTAPDHPRWLGIRRKTGWDHLGLYKSVFEALHALPAYFKPDLNEAGERATSLSPENVRAIREHFSAVVGLLGGGVSSGDED